MEPSQQEYWLPTGTAQTVIYSKLSRPVEYHHSTEMLVEDARTERTGSGCRMSSQQEKKVTTPAPTVEIRAIIQNKALWKSFMKIGNEMIVTKPGRCLFPTLLVSLRGLELKKRYQVSLRMVPVDNYRYRYSNMTWSPAGDSDVIQNHERQIFHHPCSPTSGQFWMKRPISFKSVKITHYANSKHGNILLHTMHKYVMEIIVTPQDGSQPTSLLLPETAFVAVSAYQNSEVIQLKIDNNPFAKAFKYQDKAALLEHFSEASSPKGTSQKQADGQPVPYLSQFTTKEMQTSSSSSVCSPVLCHSPLLPNSPGLHATSFSSLPASKSLLSGGSLPFYPFLPSQMQAGFFPLAAPLVSPYLMLMLCNQLCNTTKQTHINGKTTGLDEPSAMMKE